MSLDEVDSFTCSISWFYHFMKGKELTLRQKTWIGHRLSEEFEDKINSFQRMMIKMKQEKGYQLQQIVNMDKTSKNFYITPSCTVNVVAGHPYQDKGNAKITFKWY